MKTLIFLAAGLIAFFFIGACQNEPGKNYNNATKVDEDGLKLIKEGIEGGMTEIRVSDLAVTNSTNQRVINFAKMMIGDHTKADSGLKKLEADEMVGENDVIGDDRRKMINDLSKKTGSEFDKAYMEMMVKDHEAAIDLFTIGSKNTDDAINSFAIKTLPVIKMHLDSAKAISASLK